MIEDTEEVLKAMSVVPISWLTANEIAGEMMIDGDGRSIVPTLKKLLKEKKIIRSEPPIVPIEYCLSDAMARQAEHKFKRLKPPHSWFGRTIAAER
jgi:hypothetical protein